MQIALWSARAVTKHAGNLNRFRIPFKKSKGRALPKMPTADQGASISIAASIAGGMAGVGFTVRRVDKDGNVLSEQTIKANHEPEPAQASSDRPSLEELIRIRGNRRRQ